MIKSAPAFLALSLLASGMQAADRVRPGLWENTVTADGKSVTKTSCRTPAQTASVNGSDKTILDSMQKAFAKTQGCALKDVKIAGNTISWVMACADRSIASTSIYGGDTSETTISTTTAGVTKTSRIKSRRVGNCP
jgi:hypothetical protein